MVNIEEFQMVLIKPQQLLQLVVFTKSLWDMENLQAQLCEWCTKKG
jgi:hypothetical protein